MHISLSFLLKKKEKKVSTKKNWSHKQIEREWPQIEGNSCQSFQGYEATLGYEDATMLINNNKKTLKLHKLLQGSKCYSHAIPVAQFIVVRKDLNWLGSSPQPQGLSTTGLSSVG